MQQIIPNLAFISFASHTICITFSFGVFEQAKLYMVNENGTLSNTGKLACGLAAGVAEAIFAVTPMETVKVKFINDMRMEKPRFRGFFHGVRTIVREEGEFWIISPVILYQLHAVSLTQQSRQR